MHDRGRLRMSRGRTVLQMLVVALAGTVVGACGGPAPVAPVAPPTSSPPTTSTPLGLGFSDADNGRSTTVPVGQRLTVILHSSEFVFDPPSDPSVVRADGAPTVTAGGPSCTVFAGSGCGTVVASFVSLAPGGASLRARRPGEPEWTMLIDVVETGIGPTGPTTTSPPAATAPAPPSEVRGTVRFSPVCPVERIPPDPACAARPGPADVELVRPDGSVAVTVRAGDDGAFAAAATPGTYAVRSAVPGPGPGIGGGCQADPAEVTVEPGTSISVAITCDTGIR